MFQVFRYTFLICLYLNGINAKDKHKHHRHHDHHTKVKFYHTQQSTNGSIEVLNFEAINGGNDDWVARGYFDNKINRTGFGYLEVETNSQVDSLLQAFHAGYLEGLLTADLIYSRWFNVVRNWCLDDQENCAIINKFVKANSKWILEKVNASGNDVYWYQVKLIYAQLNGLLQGYNVNTNHGKLGWSDILWLNLMTEVGDIQQIANVSSSNNTPDDDHCSALVKIMPNNSDIYFGHVTWGDYSEMLRILKKYKLHYTKTAQDKSSIAGSEMAMSSYPGAIISIDDFYLMKSGLAVMETTNGVFDNTLFKDIKPVGIVWEEFRALLANRLAVDGESWHKLFKIHNSGTYNNQWMVLDYNKFEANVKIAPGALFVGEQMPPNYYTYKDVTDVLVEKGYWSSFNIPYFKDVYKMSGYGEMLNEKGTWYSYTDAPRPKIFARDEGKVEDMESFMALMRSNDFTKEPYAVCNCTPAYSAAGAISARKDLNPVDGKGVQARKSGGATDAKLTNFKLFEALRFMAICGPTTGTDQMLPEFKWSESPFASVPHLSHPDQFNFHPITVDWLLNEDNNVH